MRRGKRSNFGRTICAYDVYAGEAAVCLPLSAGSSRYIVRFSFEDGNYFWMGRFTITAGPLALASLVSEGAREVRR